MNLVVIMKILIIEDEYNLADVIKARLLQENYKVNIITDGQKGLNEALTTTYDLIVLDIMLPNLNGFAILKELRNLKIDTKIILLTAKNTIDDKLEGFNTGADDYLTKPFHIEELIARINVLLKRNGPNYQFLTLGNIKLNTNDLKLTNQETNHSIDIIGKEFQLLKMLLENQKLILSKETIFNKIWGFDSESDLNCVEAYISFIRKKLKAINSNINIKSVRNMGYKMEVDYEKHPK